MEFRNRSLTNFAVSAKYVLSSSGPSLYAKVVAGTYEYKESILDEDGFKSADSVSLQGYGFGIGFQFQSDGFFGGFIEGMYNKINLDEDWQWDSWEYVDVRAGVMLKGY